MARFPAWSDIGHRIIYEIAFQEPNKTARERVKEMIRREPEFNTFADACRFGVRIAFLTTAGLEDALFGQAYRRGGPCQLRKGQVEPEHRMSIATSGLACASAGSCSV